ncbi:hypothetical protein VB780_23130 [Leptolyngbya sp. CCNP1308]|uniref:hypothetical protein n=1 Tax=Leptolyngbya sp. CCNP1308 TaxID=3110255 RepID=UPI002B218C5E|nr:hypothetical protein [Leptolyngbya sp. CCNP1308]MEA5451490.1 hypothetical protein [Leptolyngbya sp. CCNP1308]
MKANTLTQETERLEVLRQYKVLGDFCKRVSPMVGSAHPTAATVTGLTLVSSFPEISLDTPAEYFYDDFMSLADFICDVPIALISLVDAELKKTVIAVSKSICAEVNTIGPSPLRLIPIPQN